MIESIPINPKSASSSSGTNTLSSCRSDTSAHADSLQNVGYSLVPKVLSVDHCHDALERIWDFYQDTSNDLVTRFNPFHGNENGVYPPQGFFSEFGAGWLLGKTRQILAETVFEDLFHTRKLFSSKEGFRLMVNPHESTTTTTFVQAPTYSNIQEDEPFPIYIRALIVLSTGSASNLKCNLILPSRNSKGTSTDFESVLLFPGDVLLFRSDVQVQEEYPAMSESNSDSYLNCPAVTYCTMHPAPVLESPSTRRKIWDTKIEAYKERRTGTYLVENEVTMPLLGMKGRSYFRTMPAIVSKRLAELYGLLPYDSEDPQDDIKRAIIRGVCLEDDTYEALPDSIRPRCRAQSIQLTSSDPNLLSGQDKYLGGMAAPCGKYVYGVPGTARRLLRICTKTGTMDCIGPSYSGKFKWLRGVEIPPSAMREDTNYPDGCCIALPCNHLSFLKVNPSNDKVYVFGNDILQKACQGVEGWYYHGGNLASNGWIYCIPANANYVVKVNPSTDEVILIGPCFEGRQKWYGGIIGSDGFIYGIPHNATTVLKIDPLTDNISTVSGSAGPLSEGNWKWHGGLAAGHKIIGFPNNSDYILVIDCQKSMVYTVGGPHILKSGRHRIPQDGRYKYLGGALTQDGRYAYLFPCDAERVLRFDCMTDEMVLVGPCLLDGENKAQNGFVASDGCLYGIPQRGVGVLRIIPSFDSDGSGDQVDIIPCGENMMGVKDKFEGGVMGHDGCIYCIPLRARACVKIIPEQV